MINYKNTAENIAIFFLGGILGGFIAYMAVINTANDVIGKLTPTIEHAIDKETISNDITNEITIKDNKFKKNDSLNIIIDQRPVNNQKPINVINKQKDSVEEDNEEEDTRSWIGKIFGSKKNKHN